MIVDGYEDVKAVDLLEEVGRIAKVGGWAFDPTTGRGTWTAEVARIHEVEVDAPTSMAASLSFYRGESRERIERALHDAVEHGTAFDLELDLTTRSGACKRVRMVGQPIVRDGRVVQVRGVLQDVTDVHLARTRQRHSEHLLRLFVENAPGAVAMFDREMRYLAVNKRYAAGYHLPDNDLVGRCHYDVFPEISTSAWREVHRRCLAGATESAEADPFPRADGSTDWVTWECRPWYEVDGAVGGLLLFSEVVTERASAAQALRTSDERFRVLFESAPVAMVEVDLRSGCLLRVNAKLCQLVARTETELLGLSWADLAHPDDTAELGSVVGALLAGTQTSATFEKRYVLPNGDIRWARATIARLSTGDHEATAIVVIEDVTERRSAAMVERLQTTALQAAANGIVITDRTGRIQWANDAFTRMTLYPKEELIGQRMTMLRSGAQDPAFYAELWRVILSGKTWVGELVNRRKDGTTYHEEQTITPVHGADGAITHFVGIKQDVTERRRIEQELRDSVDMLQNALEALPTPIGLATADGRCLFNNKAYRESFGYTLEDCPTIERSMELFYPDPALRARLAAQWVEDHAAAERSGIAMVARIAPVTCKNGRVRDVQFTIRPVGGYLLAILDDLTEQRRAAVWLAEAEERQRLALDVAALATWRCDFATGVVELDERAQALLSLSATATLAELAARLGRDEASGAPRETRRVIHPDGHERWIEIQTAVRFDDRARPRFAIAAAHDITEERAAVEALRVSEERYRTLMDNLDDVVFSLDRGGHLTFISPAIRNYGFSPEACLGRRFLDFVHPEDRAQAVERNQERLAGRLVGAVEYRLLDATGNTRYVNITTRTAMDGGLAGIVVDVTKIRETEHQLRAAQRMEAVGRLAGGIAHDFNNLLTVILSYADFCETSLVPGDVLHQDVREIIRAANRATALTRQLLAFSRRQILQLEPVELGELIDSLGKMLHRLIGEDIDLVITPSDPCTAMVDRGQMEQVVMNLIVNARDAMPDGGRLTISRDTVKLDEATATSLEVSPGEYIRIEIADTGIGMDPPTVARIFEPFFTTKGPGKGTGLGLSTVYGIVKQSHGGIAVDTSPGAGARFSIYVPAVAAQAPRVRPRVTGLAAGNETLLIVEDEAPLRAAVVRTLRAAGYRVLAASSPKEALSMASAHGSSIALILTDVVMPEMNGRELAERLTPLCPRSLILYTSGYTDEELVRSGVLGEEFLPKPFDPSTLTRRIRSLLDRSQGSARAEAPS